MSLTLVQCASGRFVDLQKEITPHHQAYCNRHGYNYQVFYGSVQQRYCPMWDKVVLIRNASEHSDMVVWMDTDSLIVDTNTPLEEAFSDVLFVGHCKHPEKWKSNFWHYNCGVGFYRDNDLVFDFLTRVWERGIVPHPTWKVQATMLEINDEMRIMSVLDDKWNSTVETNESKEPVIQSWHGHNLDFAPILKRLSEVR